MPTLQQLELDLDILLKRKDALQKEFTDCKIIIDKEIQNLQTTIQLIIKGFSPEKIEEARKIIYIYGLHHYGYGDTKKAVEDAINALAHGGESLYTQYIGCKNYAGYCLREDHPYGYSPKHGSIVFKIGLRDPSYILASQDIEACLYYLNTIKDTNYRDILMKANDPSW